MEPAGGVAVIAAFLADLVVAAHAAFVLFAVLGGLLVLRRPGIAWVHVPAAVWAILVEIFGWICPLTPLEIALRRKAGQAGYQHGFLEQYLEPLLYPQALTPAVQVALGVFVLVVNAVIYALVLRRYRRRQPDARSTSSASARKDGDTRTG